MAPSQYFTVTSCKLRDDRNEVRRLFAVEDRLASVDGVKS
jgi:hypothetical protein